MTAASSGLDVRASSLPPDPGRRVEQDAGDGEAGEFAQMRHKDVRQPWAASTIVRLDTINDLAISGVGQKAETNGARQTRDSGASIQGSSSGELVSSKPSPSGSSIATDDDSGYTQMLLGRHCLSDSSARGTLAAGSKTMPMLNSRDEFVVAMTEDLAEWLSRLYPTTAGDLDADNFFSRLADGVLLCRHACELHRRLGELFPGVGQKSIIPGIRITGIQAVLPNGVPAFQTRTARHLTSSSLPPLPVLPTAPPPLLASTAASFVARDNIANFLTWCRQLRMSDAVLFETEDLISRRHLRNVIVCLLELARFGGRLGFEVPEIVNLESEIEAELAADLASVYAPRPRESDPFNGCLSANLGGNKAEALHQSAGSPLDQVSLQTVSDTNQLRFVGTAESATASAEPRDREVWTSGGGGGGGGGGAGAGGRGLSNCIVAQTGVRLNRAQELRQRKNRRSIDHQSTGQSGRAEVEASNGGCAKQRHMRPVVDLRSLDEMVCHSLWSYCMYHALFCLPKKDLCRRLICTNLQLRQSSFSFRRGQFTEPFYPPFQMK
ncbi:unnamed protein product [Protopolystoma xenopodis]|uniref:Calponin-homology (CH) domain-containing protein n=1 Tax=Protopolystoma xenopodis TaxID=117903 RepID=A0A448WNJ9_9PLAT|nr:unnamed protein product [Protopolystoma xenopodis]